MLGSILKFVFRALLIVLALVLVAWSGYRTYDLLAYTTGDSLIIPLLGLAVFDGGFVIWTFYFLYSAEGLTQRAVALVASMTNMILVIGASAADIWLNSVKLTGAPPETWWGEAATWLIVFATGANIVLMWLAHMTEPSAQHEMRMRSMQDKIREEAYRQLENKVSSIAGRVADHLSDQLRDDAVRGVNGRTDIYNSAAMPAQSVTVVDPMRPALTAETAMRADAWPRPAASQPAEPAPAPMPVMETAAPK